MLVKAARELCIVQEDLAGFDPDEPTADDIAHAIPQVLAVLRMIREPSNSVIAAGRNVMMTSPVTPHPRTALIWQAMIDTITTKGAGE